jgi:hypothetical protein
LISIFVVLVALNLEGIDGNYDKLFSAIGSFGSVFIGYAAYRISKEQQRSTNQKISDEEKEIIRRHYKKTDLLFLKIRSTGLKKDKAEADFHDLKMELCDLADSAAVEMPEGFEEKMKELFNFLERAKKLEIKADKDLIGFVEESSEFRRKLESIYTKYLKIPTKNHEN